MKYFLRPEKNKRLLLLWAAILSVFTLAAQDFYGVVKKLELDSSVTAVYQAKVDLISAGEILNSVKTYYDGGYKFTLGKNQHYAIRISFAGYKDTAFTFTTDKYAKPSLQNVTVKLKKDGMRVLGMVRSREENFPIKGATVILKNVMTREEQRVTTAVDGAFNFKLLYETNYRLTIDKRSPGIINKYRDTTFYISTIGFNQPLDYRLDIYLNEDQKANTELLEEYDPTAKPENKHLKPTIDVVNKKYITTTPTTSQNTIPDAPATENVMPAKPVTPKVEAAPVVVVPKTIMPETLKPVAPVVEKKKIPKAVATSMKTPSQLKADLEKAQTELADLKKKEAELTKAAKKSPKENKKKKKGKGPELEVVIIRSGPSAKPLSLSEVTRQRQEAEKKIKQIEEDLALVKAMNKHNK